MLSLVALAEVVLLTGHATHPAGWQVCCSASCGSYPSTGYWMFAVACHSLRTCLSFVLRWAFCILPLRLLLPVAVCASAPTQPAGVAGYWCLGCFLVVRMVPWPLVHSPSFLQAPACLVITLGRWTVARLPW